MQADARNFSERQWTLDSLWPWPHCDGPHEGTGRGLRRGLWARTSGCGQLVTSWLRCPVGIANYGEWREQWVMTSPSVSGITQRSERCTIRARWTSAIFRMARKAAGCCARALRACVRSRSTSRDRVASGQPEAPQDLPRPVQIRLPDFQMDRIRFGAGGAASGVYGAS